jgi:hypothetical protein
MIVATLSRLLYVVGDTLELRGIDAGFSLVKLAARSVMEYLDYVQA